MADINEVVVRGSAAGFAQEILAGRHPLTADEPAQLAAFHMTLEEQNMGCSEVFVDHPTGSAQWSFRARVRNREATNFTPNFTLP